MIYSTFPFCDFPEYYLSHKENRHGAFSSDHEYTVLWYRVVGLFFPSFFICVWRSLAILSSYCTQMSIKVDGAFCYMWSGILFWNSIHLCDRSLFSNRSSCIFHLIILPLFSFTHYKVSLSLIYSLIKVCKVIFHNIDSIVVINMFLSTYHTFNIFCNCISIPFLCIHF